MRNFYKMIKHIVENKMEILPLLRIVQIYASEAASTVRTKLVSCFTQVF